MMKDLTLDLVCFMREGNCCQREISHASIIYTQLTGGRTMRFGLKGRIVKIFNQVFVGGVGDTAYLIYLFIADTKSIL